MQVLVAPNGRLSLRLCPSDKGDDALSPFAFYDMRITTAVEITTDRVLLTARGRTRLYEVDLSTRLAVGHFDNPSGAATQLAMVKHPYFEDNGYLILKDTKFVSIVDTK